MERKARMAAPDIIKIAATIFVILIHHKTNNSDLTMVQHNLFFMVLLVVSVVLGVVLFLRASKVDSDKRKCLEALFLPIVAGLSFVFLKKFAVGFFLIISGYLMSGTLGKEDIVVDMLIVDTTVDLFTLTSLGYGKRSKMDDYRLQSRGGKGIKAGIFNEKTGYLVSLKPVTDENDIMIITTGGTIIRMHADTISCIGRSTRGVRVMNVKDSLVATVDITERDDEAETQAPEETAADLSAEDLAGEVDEVEENEEVVLDDEVVDEAPADDEE